MMDHADDSLKYIRYPHPNAERVRELLDPTMEELIMPETTKTETTTQATSRPWCRNHIGGKPCIFDNNFGQVAEVLEEADADLICTIANHHDDLIHACDLLLATDPADVDMYVKRADGLRMVIDRIQGVVR